MIAFALSLLIGLGLIYLFDKKMFKHDAAALFTVAIILGFSALVIEYLLILNILRYSIHFIA